MNTKITNFTITKAHGRASMCSDEYQNYKFHNYKNNWNFFHVLRSSKHYFEPFSTVFNRFQPFSTASTFFKITKAHETSSMCSRLQNTVLNRFQLFSTTFNHFQPFAGELYTIGEGAPEPLLQIS